MSRWLRYAWAAPNSALGLALAATAWMDGDVGLVDGVVEAHGRTLRWLLTRLVPLPGGAAAITLGHVVVAVDAIALERTRAHERIHVGQYERWGPLFLPAYAAASLWAWLRGEHVYLGNRFEREAWRPPGRDAAAPCAQEGQDHPWMS